MIEKLLTTKDLQTMMIDIRRSRRRPSEISAIDVREI